MGWNYRLIKLAWKFSLVGIRGYPCVCHPERSRTIPYVPTSPSDGREFLLLAEQPARNSRKSRVWSWHARGPSTAFSHAFACQNYAQDDRVIGLTARLLRRWDL